MLTIHVLPRRLKEFLLTHPLYKSPMNPYPDFFGIRVHWEGLCLPVTMI